MISEQYAETHISAYNGEYLSFKAICPKCYPAFKFGPFRGQLEDDNEEGIICEGCKKGKAYFNWVPGGFVIAGGRGTAIIVYVPPRPEEFWTDEMKEKVRFLICDRGYKVYPVENDYSFCRMLFLVFYARRRLG